MSHFTLLVLDTSCSMHQKTLHHLSTLDLTKSAMERLIHQAAALPPSILKQPASADGSSQNDGSLPPGSNFSLNSPHISNSSSSSQQRRFLLSTCHGTIKGDLLKKIKSLSAWDLTTIELALRDGLREMNKWRVSKGVDRFGQGRWIGCAEPSCVIVLTDRGKLTSMERGTSDRLMVSMDAGGVVMQHQWCVEPFRWDQKIFGIVLGVPYYEADDTSGGNKTNARGSSHNSSSDASQSNNDGIQLCTDSVLSPLCEVTGGACVQVRNMKQLFEYVDHLAQNVLRHDCVVVDFELWFQQQQQDSNASSSANLPSSSNSQQITSPHTSIFIHTKQNYWPIPESYFPTSKLTQIPPRHAHPKICIQASSHPIDIPEGFPLDQYEIDSSSAVAQFLIQNKITQNGLYRCYVRNSGPPSMSTNNPYGAPFGFVKAILPNPNSTHGPQHPSAHFFVLPYNYPVLFKLIRDIHLYQMQHQMPPTQWKHEFEKYCMNIPPYYVNVLKSCLQLYYMKSPISSIVESLFPSHLDTSLSYSLVTKITNMTKQEKHENEMDAQKKAAAQKASQQGNWSSASGAATRTADLIRGIGEGADSAENKDSSSSTTDFRSILMEASSSSGKDESSGGGGGGGTDGNSASTSSSSTDGDASSSSTTDSTLRTISDIFSDSNRNISRDSIVQRMIDTKFSKKNPFDIHRSELLSQHENMRCRLFGEEEIQSSKGGKTRVLDRTLASKLAIARHSIPINQMGDYGAAAAKKYILRDPLSEDSADHRLVNFGSPYAKKKKKSNKFLKNLSIDEADAAPQMQQEQHGQKKQYAQRRERAQPKKRPKQQTSSRKASPVANPPASNIGGTVTGEASESSEGKQKQQDQKSPSSPTPIENAKHPTTPDSVSSPGQQKPVTGMSIPVGPQMQPAAPTLLANKRRKRPAPPQQIVPPQDEPPRKKMKLHPGQEQENELWDPQHIYREMLNTAPQILNLPDQFINNFFNAIALKQAKEKNRSTIENIQQSIRAPQVSEHKVLTELNQLRGYYWKDTKHLLQEMVDYAEEFRKWALKDRIVDYIESKDKEYRQT